jgi:hypothetical protein
MFRRLALFSIITGTALALSFACSSGEKTSSDDDGAAGSGTAGLGQGGGSFAGAGNGGYGSTIIIGTGSTGSGTGSTGSGTGSTGSGTGSTSGGASCEAPDGSGPSECSDGMDNDGDGAIDGFDVECTGACDDDESSFATGIPGDNKDPHQDCFFDGDSGAGNDGCRDQENPSDECIAFCKALTSNGCDCFGCCTVRMPDDSLVSVQLGGECADFETDVGTDKCQTCTPATECMNECGECELCPGKTEADLPESCFETGTGGGSGTGGSGGGVTCDNGAKVCDSSSDCGTSGYCQLGCCVTIVVK